MRAVSTMSKRGFLTSPVDQANEEMLNFYLCHHDQPENFIVRAQPLSRLLQLYGEEPSVFAKEIKSALEMWLNYSFDSAEVDVVIVDPEAPNTNLQIGVILRVAGTKYQLSHLLITEGTRMVDVLNENGDQVVIQRNR